MPFHLDAGVPNHGDKVACLQQETQITGRHFSAHELPRLAIKVAPVLGVSGGTGGTGAGALGGARQLSSYDFGNNKTAPLAALPISPAIIRGFVR